MKLFRLLLLLPCMIYAGDNDLTRINKSSLHVAHEIGKMALYHNGTSFIAKQNGVKTEIGSECLDGALRNVNARNLAAFMKAGRIQATKANDGSIMLRHCVDGKGGGYWGAMIGFYTGKILVHGVAQGAMWTVAFCSGPAFYPVLATLENTFAVPVEAASNVVGLGCSFLGGAASGPL